MKNNTKNQNAVVTVETSEIYASNYCFRHVIVLALAFVVVTASLGVAKEACAEPNYLYRTGFERSKFQGGEQLLGLDGWSTAIPPFLNPTAAKITEKTASHGRQSVEVRGEELNRSEQNGILQTPPYDAVGSYRRPLDYEISTAKPVARVEADLLIDTNEAVTLGEFFSLTIAARSGDGETLGEIGLSSNGTIEAWGFDPVPGDPPEFVEPATLGLWYHITMLLDFANRTTSYFINGHHLGTVDAPSGSNTLLRGAMVVYARPDGDPDTGPGSTRSNYTARIDDFHVSVIGN